MDFMKPFYIGNRPEDLWINGRPLIEWICVFLYNGTFEYWGYDIGSGNIAALGMSLGAHPCLLVHPVTVVKWDFHIQWEVC